MSTETSKQYKSQIDQAFELFKKKQKDYGQSWRILRIPSLIDQLYIKAKRIRSIEENEIQKVEDAVEDEYTGLVNYSIITLIQREYGKKGEEEIPEKQLFEVYTKHAERAFELMNEKNHDYGEAWREMYISSLTDLILAKLLRIRQIIENKEKLLASEGIEAGLYDIINYSIFALIKLEENGEDYNNA